MTRNEKVINLYKETYADENLEELSIDEMEEALKEYYLATGFEINSVDELFENRDVNPDFDKEMEKKIQVVLKELAEKEAKKNA